MHTSVKVLAPHTQKKKPRNTQEIQMFIHTMVVKFLLHCSDTSNQGYELSGKKNHVL